MNNPEQERAEFEAWLNPEYSRELDGMGCYKEDTVFSMFSAWQAARRAPVVPEWWIKYVIEAWRCVRKHNHSIPDNVLDEMKSILLAAKPLSR